MYNTRTPKYPFGPKDEDLPPKSVPSWKNIEFILLGDPGQRLKELGKDIKRNFRKEPAEIHQITQTLNREALLKTSIEQIYARGKAPVILCEGYCNSDERDGFKMIRNLVESGSLILGAAVVPISGDRTKIEEFEKTLNNVKYIVFMNSTLTKVLESGCNVLTEIHKHQMQEIAEERKKQEIQKQRQLEEQNNRQERRREAMRKAIVRNYRPIMVYSAGQNTDCINNSRYYFAREYGINVREIGISEVQPAYSFGMWGNSKFIVALDGLRHEEGKHPLVIFSEGFTPTTIQGFLRDYFIVSETKDTVFVPWDEGQRRILSDMRDSGYNLNMAKSYSVEDVVRACCKSDYEFNTEILQSTSESIEFRVH